MKMQDLVDDKVIVQTALPEELRNPTPVMPDINISEPGILKLLKNLKLKKSADPEWIKHVILQGLRDELVPILKVLFDRSLNPVLCHIYGTQQCLTHIQKRVKNQLLQIIGIFPFHTSCVR